jgi:regulator of RNase E activity RraA
MFDSAISPEDEVLFSKLRRATVDSLWNALSDLGFPNQFVNGLACIHPNLKMVGRAITLRYLPLRQDIAERIPDNGAWDLHKQMADAARPGDILVIDAGGETGGGCLGDIVFSRLVVRGAAGLVCDGAIRDLAIIKEMNVPIYVRGFHAAGYGRVLMAMDRDISVRIAKVTVVPGDILVGDQQGFLVIPSHLADEVADRALALDHEEKFQREKILQDPNVTLLDAYPMSESLRKEYEEWEKEHPRQQ